VRAAVDRRVAALARDREADDEAWHRLIAEGVARAPHGSALWFGDDPPSHLPDGFAWLRAARDDLRSLPRDHFRLVVAPAAGTLLDRLGLVLEPGGVLIAQHVDQGTRWPETLSLLATDERSGSRLVLARRDRG
jgi:hypothetical protein